MEHKITSNNPLLQWTDHKYSQCMEIKGENYCNNVRPFPWLYPNSDEKEYLCSISGKTKKQVENFFTNLRRRDVNRARRKYEECARQNASRSKVVNLNVPEETLQREKTNIIATGPFPFSTLTLTEINHRDKMSSQSSTCVDIPEPDIQLSFHPLGVNHPSSEGKITLSLKAIQHFMKNKTEIISEVLPTAMPPDQDIAESVSNVEPEVNDCSTPINSEEDFIKACEGENKSVILQHLANQTSVLLYSFIQQFRKNYPHLPLVYGYLAFQKTFPKYVNSSSS